MKERWFEKWFNTRYYHLLYHHRDEDEAFQFINNIISFLQPPPQSTLLDVACGKGRHAIHLSDMGFDVTGIDLSEESITHAVQSENEQLHFFIHDMRNPFRINYYDIAFNFFTSFGYFESQQENIRAMRSIAEGIRPNGFFILDYLNPSYTESMLVPKEKKTIEGVEFDITRSADASFFYKTITVNDPEKSEKLKFSEKVSRLNLTDFENMMKLCGLRIQRVWGDYDLNAFDPESSPRMIIMAEKIIKNSSSSEQTELEDTV